MNPKDLIGAKKAQLRLVPPAAVIGMASGLSVGAVKYGPFNWRAQPIENVTYVEAAFRHLFAYLDGEETAKDTVEFVGYEVHHIDAALAGLGILRDAIASGKVVDVRAPAGPAPELLKEFDRSVKPKPIDITDIVESMRPRYVDEPHALAEVEYRGEWPPDTRVDGRLTCCGATSHTLTCPQYR